MKHLLAATAALALTIPAIPVIAQDAEPEDAQAHSSSEAVAPNKSPNAIVEEAPASEWVAIPAEDLLVMTLAPGSNGLDRQVVIQLMPAPFSQGWVENIRTLARAGWYDGVSVNRVQDNYVVQWGDPNVDNPEAEGEAKPLPEGLRVMGEDQYAPEISDQFRTTILKQVVVKLDGEGPTGWTVYAPTDTSPIGAKTADVFASDPYAFANLTYKGWPLSLDNGFKAAAPVHCYGMVGVGRSYSPDTGTGAELYTVIGHAPRHLDRNIALVGRVIEGIEHLSSLPRGTGPLGFYETAEERVPIQSIRTMGDLPDRQQPAFEYLSTDSEAFARYADARANRRDPFFIEPAGGADICNIPVPVRRVVESASD